MGNHSYESAQAGQAGPGKGNYATENLLKEIGYRTQLCFVLPMVPLDRQRSGSGSLGYKIIAWNVDSLDWKG